MATGSNIDTSSVAAVQLRGYANEQDDWSPELATAPEEETVPEDKTLITTQKALDLVEQELNMMKAETEANLEIAEAESVEAEMGKKHKRKHKHGKHKKAKKAGKSKKVTQSHAQTASVPACTSLGCEKGSAADPKKDPWPKDYKVPNFGADHDIAVSEKNSAAAEKKLGAWVPKKDEDGKFVVPKEEHEFRLTGTEADVRLGATSDPICSSAGCTQYQHPHKDDFKMNYFVPDFGKDHDIKVSDANAELAEGILGHTFTPKYDEEKDVWVVPTEEAEFRLAGVKSDVHLEKEFRPSDPSCSSAGWCGESLWPKGKVDKKHAVLRHDTQRGANQAPTPEEAEKNHEKIINSRPDPHPNTDEPETPESKTEREAREAALEKVANTESDEEPAKRTKSSLLKDEEWVKAHSSNAQKS